MKNTVFILCILASVILFSKDLVSQSKSNEQNNNVYFCLSNNNCTSCCVTAINLITKDLKKSNPDYKIFMVINEDNAKLTKLLRKKLSVDSIINKNEFQKIIDIEAITNNDMFIVSQSGQLIKHICNFTNTIQLTEPDIKSVDIREMSDNDSIIPNDFLKPYIDENNNLLYLIQPDQCQIVCYDLINYNFTKSIKPQKKEKFLMYDPQKYDINYWESTYNHYPDMNKYFSILSTDNNCIKTISYIFSGYNINKEKTNLVWMTQCAAIKNCAGDLSYHTIDRKYFVDYNKRVLFLNDTISILQASDTLLSKRFMLFINKYSDSIYSDSHIDSLINSVADSNCIISFGKSSTVFVYNKDSNMLTSISTDNNNQQKILNYIIDHRKSDYSCHSMFVHNNILYCFWITDSNVIYVEEYNTVDNVFRKGYYLDDLKKNKFKFYDIAGVYKNKLLIYAKDTSNNWFVKLFTLGSLHD